MDYRWVDSTAVCLEMRTAGSTVDTKAAGMDDVTAVLWVPSSVDINSLSSLLELELYWCPVLCCKNFISHSFSASFCLLLI